MLTKIKVHGLSTFFNASVLETDKKVNLVYGLNGSGKSTICKFLRNPEGAEFTSCFIEGGEGATIFVFNDDFIHENFYESEKIPGIFSLSKENKEFERMISEASTSKATLLAEKESQVSAYTSALSKLKAEKEKVVEAIFEIKRKYSGGDRILKFCLEGMMANKDKLAEHLCAISKPVAEPEFTVKQLQEEARRLTTSQGKPPETELKMIPSYNLVETHALFKTAIVGSQDSTFARFINNLRNSDWIRQGLEKYVNQDGELPQSCPFCQQPTLSNHILEHLRCYFDKTYDVQIAELNSLCSNYIAVIERIPKLSEYQKSLFYSDSIGVLYTQLQTILLGNKLLLDKKVESPSTVIELEDTTEAVNKLNTALAAANANIVTHNEKVRNAKISLAEINSKFWSLMRWQYDANIVLMQTIDQDMAQLQKSHKGEIDKICAAISQLDKKIVELQRQVVNTDEAIGKINAELVKMGIMDFAIRKHETSAHLYELARSSEVPGSFKTLSEGEKMIISLLYFCELCMGTQNPDKPSSKRIVVLDDPISSLSHIFIFNVGRLIWSHFLRNAQIEQVFIFTHSLYFFYELTEINPENRKATQALFRVSKDATGSKIFLMSYEDIQNDYHSYWQIVNNQNSPPALIANCMRNILEYFFGFVEKTSFGNVFQKSALQEPHFQAFNRYMNRESHSFGQNVFDLKEFDYEAFRRGFKLIFEECGYREHYRKMEKIR
ncbi:MULTISPECIES: AAA family ATPase [Nitrosomonas]|uniref:Wobble nucleotide-excising tRNase n=1 Tax=Nitrosomonas communis TaxID=44574 RepID=A0A0F7KDP1_9PROT|nr:MULTISPECIES: AAA family ATPase [Nitrosomonas]AKH36892.1 hypothetical protein AAW31_02255 [Nitrosomonas communis]TYP83889.1 wobble nucleotide-excising tRNase [Nitrosomonas communis]UVS61998.1 AAA family ATPase [Nitrosomonas sp. PLL12]